jgi:hypothetical protein
MQIPRYWAYAKNNIRNAGGLGYQSEPYTIYWRSSEISVADAQAKADEAAERVRKFLETPEHFNNIIVNYPYNVRNIREKLLEEITDASGRVQAFLSRNSAGAVVLNVADVMFLDWDTAKPSLAESLIWLWNKLMPFPLFKINSEHRNALESLTSATMEPDYIPPELREIKEIKHIIKFVQDNSDWGIRIYKTAAGYRGLVTHTTFDPQDKEVSKLMDSWYCDPHYKMLCRLQVSFRARLTPKGDRLGLWGRPRVLPWEFRFKYPWLPEDTAYAELYDKAVRVYEERRKEFATCRYLGTLGSGKIHQLIAPIVALHDAWTLDDDKRLA